jgi:tetratricopeptide (TPR) repeat protein
LFCCWFRKAFCQLSISVSVIFAFAFGINFLEAYFRLSQLEFVVRSFLNATRDEGSMVGERTARIEDRGVRIIRQMTSLAIGFLATQFSCYASSTLARCQATPVTDTVHCVEDAIHSQSGSAASKTQKRPDACKALDDLRTFRAGNLKEDSPAPDIDAALRVACADQRSLNVADQLFAEGRYAEAAPLYSAIATKLNDKNQADKELDWVIDQAVRGNLDSTRFKNYVNVPPRPVVLLERQSKFEEAYAEAALSLAETDPHRKLLAQYLGLVAQTRDLEKRGEPKVALSLFNKYQSSVDPTRDQYLLSATFDQIAQLEPLARAQNNLEARTLLAVGNSQSKRAQYADAEASYNKVLNGHPDDIDPDIAIEAERKLSEVRRLEVEEPSFTGTWRNFTTLVRKFFFDLVVWLLDAILLALVLGTAVCVAFGISAGIRGNTKPGIFLSLKDNTSNATDLGNQLLSEQMRREMDLPVPNNPSDPILGNTNTRLRISSPGEMQGSSIGQAGILVPLRNATTVFQSATQISFGSFSINPIQIFNSIKPFFRRRYQLELEGTLSQLGQSVVCSVAIASGSLPNMQGLGPWEAVWSGAEPTDNRNQAIRDCASQILIAIDSETRHITANPRSLANLQIGIGLLQRASYDLASQQDLWAQARVAFQQSVLQDPGNWLARFNLATVLRNLDFNSLAAEQFAELLNNESLQKELIVVAKYNRASALQKVDDRNVSKEVLATFDDILETPGLDPALELLTRSARLAAMADFLARTKRFLLGIGVDPSHKIQPAELDDLFAVGNTLCKEIWTSIAKGSGPNGSSCNIVLAVTLNAMGQLQALMGSSKKAREFYRRALTLLPSFTEPALNLADLYMEKKGSFDKNWATRTESLLLDVQKIEPANLRCLVLLGILYADTVFDRDEDAIALLKKAMPHPETGKRLAGIFFNQGKPADAIAPLQSSLKQLPTDSGYLFFTRCALALPSTDLRRRQLLETCLMFLKKLAESDGSHHSASDKKEAISLLPKVKEALDKA